MRKNLFFKGERLKISIFTDKYSLSEREL